MLLRSGMNIPLGANFYSVRLTSPVMVWLGWGVGLTINSCINLNIFTVDFTEQGVARVIAGNSVIIGSEKYRK